MHAGLQWILQVMMSSQVLGLIGNRAPSSRGQDCYTSTFALSSSRQQHQNHLDQSRRKVLEHSTTALCAPLLGTVLATLPASSVLAKEKVESTTLRPTIQNPFRYSDTWTGTNLSLLSLAEAVVSVLGSADAPVKVKAETTRGTGRSRPRVQVDTGGTTVPAVTIATWNMGRWPDPILRRPAEAVNGDAWFGTDTLLQACQILQKTADQHRALGLTAQQCGVNARIVYVNLQASKALHGQYPLLRIPIDETHAKFLMMINPSIVRRSPESEMTCWTEECLVLPRSFRATLLRDKWVDVHYWTPMGEPQQSRLSGELARCFQHELDHDRGVLTLDHISLDEMESDAMRDIEVGGHESRMLLAYSRDVLVVERTSGMK